MEETYRGRARTINHTMAGDLRIDEPEYENTSVGTDMRISAKDKGNATTLDLVVGFGGLYNMIRRT